MFAPGTLNGLTEMMWMAPPLLGRFKNRNKKRPECSGATIAVVATGNPANLGEI